MIFFIPAGLTSSVATAAGETIVRADNKTLDNLIAGMASGDIAALETLYLHTKTAVYGYALSILKHHHNAEDVMQETYVRLYSSAAQYMSMGKPMAWILRVTKNLALMKLREREESPLPEYGYLADGDDFTERSAERMVLSAAMETLGDEERQILMLHSVSGLKHREIAVIMDIPLSTVLSKYRRSLIKLKKTIEEDQA